MMTSSAALIQKVSALTPMGSFGDKLKREREMRGVTLDEIAESTKIRRFHLEALESEDFASLPGGVFNKGFVKAYAHYIGIDEDQAVADYAAISNEVPPPEDQFPLEIHEKPDRELNPRISQLPLIGAVVALVLVVAGYVAWRAKHHVAEGMVPSAAAASRPVDADQPEVRQHAQPVEPAVRTDSVATTPAPVEKRVAATSSVPEKPPVVAPESPKKSPEAARNAAVDPKHSFFVIIKAKEDAWISVVADGRRVSHGVLRADRQKFIRAGKQILLTTGNAGGIDVSFNGRPLGAIGNESEARTLLFTPTGAAQQ